MTKQRKQKGFPGALLAVGFGAMPPFWITRLGDHAAVRNNELEPEMNL